MIEPINFGAALRRSWRLLIVLAVVFALVAAVIPVSAGKSGKGGKNKLKYQSTTTVATPPVNSSSQRGGAQSILFWSGDFYVKEQAIHAAFPTGVTTAQYQGYIQSMSGAPASLTKSTAKSNKPIKANQASIVTLTAGGTTATLSAKLAADYAAAVGAAVKKQYQANAQAAAAKAGQKAAPVATITTSQVFIVLLPALASGATKVKASKSSLTSSRKVRLLAGAGIGLVIGAGIVLVRELLDKRLRTATRAESTFKYPVLVELPARAWKRGFGRSSPVVEVVTDPTSSTAEAYRMLRMSVMFEGLAPAQPTDSFDEGMMAPWATYAPEPYKPPEPGSRQVVLVVSPGSEASRPVVSANLGATYGEAGQRVIVVSTSDVASGYASSAVMSPFDIGPADVAARLLPSTLENVSRLSLRHFVANSGQLVTHAPAVLDAARQLADVVIVEAPPLLTVHHGEALVHAVDLVLVVGECGTTTFEQAARAGDLLRRMGAPVLGVVLTEVRLSTKEMKQALARAQVHAPELTETPEVPRQAQPIPEITQA